MFSKVDIRSFDAGLVETLGAQLIDNNYYLTIEGVKDRIPVIMVAPEIILEEYTLPSVIIRREGYELALSRYNGARFVRQATIGPTERILQWVAMPIDISYDVQCYARYRQQVNKIFEYLQSKLLPQQYIKVVDSEGDIRSYDAIVEGFSVLDEIADVADRVLGFSVSIRVMGEIDLLPEEPMKTFDPSKSLKEVVNVDIMHKEG